MIHARLGRELTGGRYPTRGRSGFGTVVLVDDAVLFVAQEERVWVLYRLPMVSWWPLLPGHVHTFGSVRVRAGLVRLCVFCGAQVA